ncbi:hypothetical protein [Comamonas piscis]
MLSLFKIEDVFDITGRGCILVPGIPYSLHLAVKPGARLRIVSPKGKVFYTKIAAFERFHRKGEVLTHAAFSIERDILKVQLEIGSEVFLADEDYG